MSSAMFNLILEATLDTLYMVAVSGVIAALVGIPLGVLLYVTRPGQILAQPVLQSVLGIISPRHLHTQLHGARARAGENRLRHHPRRHVPVSAVMPGSIRFVHNFDVLQCSESNVTRLARR